MVRLQGSLLVEYTLARRGSQRLWNMLNTEDYVRAYRAFVAKQKPEFEGN